MARTEIINSGVTKFYRSVYSVAAQGRERGLVFYGAGFWGEVSFRIFAKIQVYPVCFCDDAPEKQGTLFVRDGHTVPVLSLDEAAEKYPNAVYIATAASGASAPRTEMNHRLKERGLLDENSGFHPLRYLFLLEGGLEALAAPKVPGEQEFKPDQLNRMMVLNHMSSSGIIYLDTLLDGHPNVLNIVMLGENVPLQDIYRERLQYLEDEELVLETASQMTPYLATGFPETVFSGAIHRPAAYYYWNELGAPEERIYLPAERFVSALGGVLRGKGRVSFAFLLKAIFAAYQNTLGTKCVSNQDCWILYERHKFNYDLCELDGLLFPGDFHRVEYWFIIREPIRHIFSWLKRMYLNAVPEEAWFFGRPEAYLGRLACDIGAMLKQDERNKEKTVKIVRFEDTKRRLHDTMQSICDSLEIPFDPCVLNTTANSIPVYFPSGSQTRLVLGTDSMAALERKDFSSLMSDYDIFRLNLVFQDFRRTFGYDCDMPDYRQFSKAFLQELFQEPFRFEPLLDACGKSAQKAGRLDPGQRAQSHDYIVELFMSYTEQGPYELFCDLVEPADRRAGDKNG